jgi:hypothetical protein
MHTHVCAQELYTTAKQLADTVIPHECVFLDMLDICSNLLFARELSSTTSAILSELSRSTVVVVASLDTDFCRIVHHAGRLLFGQDHKEERYA